MRPLVVLAAFFAAAFLSYARVFDNGFWGDNFDAIVHAAWVWTDPSELWRVWLGGNFRFFSQAMLALAYKVFGLSPGRYVFLTFVLHVLNGFLLSRVAHRLTRDRWKGVVVGLLFTVGLGHYGSSLFTITEITGIASLTFTLLAFESICGRSSRKVYTFAVGFLVLAVFTKETASAVFPLFGLWVYLRETDRRRQWTFWGLLGLSCLEPPRVLRRVPYLSPASATFSC